MAVSCDITRTETAPGGRAPAVTFGPGRRARRSAVADRSYRVSAAGGPSAAHAYARTHARAPRIRDRNLVGRRSDSG